jgi:transposase-like protein
MTRNSKKILSKQICKTSKSSRHRSQASRKLKYDRKKRGQYRKYSTHLKREAIALAIKLNNSKEAAARLNVPPKNLKRWMQSGPIRKKGGRKTQDPDMEKKLYFWINGYLEEYSKMPPAKAIKQMALKYSKYAESFKASKGWMEKFLARHNLNRRARTSKSGGNDKGSDLQPRKNCDYISKTDLA